MHSRHASVAMMESSKKKMCSGIFFHWQHGSKFKQKSAQQDDMMRTITSTHQNGIIVSPCGSGKSAVIIESALNAGTMCLFICFEAQGAQQMKDDLLNNTTLLPSQICMHSGKSRDKPQSRFCFVVTTYGMFSTDGAHSSSASKKMREFLFETKWDLICFDEAHHMCAKTYKPMVKNLTAKRKLGFTATLFRNELCTETQNREEHEREAFGWFGPVLYRSNCKALEESGIIARIRRAVVKVELTDEFRVVYNNAQGAQKKYISSLNPSKLNAIKATAAMHKILNHMGVVFASHLLAAKVLKDCLNVGGSKWEILSGGNAHGMEEAHNAEVNADIVRRFNAGELDGLVCTPVGNSSMDLHHPRFVWVGLAEGNGSSCCAAQQLGRVARSPRVVPFAEEDDDSVTERRLKQQKQAFYYDFVTKNTEDEAAAKRRQLLFATEGYGEEVSIPPETMLKAAREHGTPLAYKTLMDEMLLLKEVLQYRSLEELCAQASSAATRAKAPQRQVVKRHVEKAKHNRNKIFRAYHEKQAKVARKKQTQINIIANNERRKTIQSAPLSEHSQTMIKMLNLPCAVLEAIGMRSEGPGFFVPSEDESEDGEE